ncbi:unnamed protein product, partial [Cylicostephanus goldi]
MELCSGMRNAVISTEIWSWKSGCANAQYLYKGTDKKSYWPEWNVPPQLYYLIVILAFVVIRDLVRVLVRKAHKAYKRRSGSGTEGGSKCRTIVDKDNLLERGLLLTPTSKD